MAEELTDSKLSKIKVGCMSSFLGREAIEHEKIFICGGLFVQLHKNSHVFRYTYRDENKKQKQITLGIFALDGNGSSTLLC